MSTFNTGITTDLSIRRLGKPGGFASLGSDGKLLPSQYSGESLEGLRQEVTALQNAGYQTEAQVDASIQEIVGAAPAALDTLQEIAAALAEDDSAIAALVAQDTVNSTAITALQADSHKAATSGNAAIEINNDQEVSLKLSSETDNQISLKPDGVFVVKTGINIEGGGDLYDPGHPDTYTLRFNDKFYFSTPAANTVEVRTEGIQVSGYTGTAPFPITNFSSSAGTFSLGFFNADIVQENLGDTAYVKHREASSSLPGMLSAVDKTKLDNINAQANKIRRLNLTTDITLTNADAEVQNLINTTSSDRTITLPSSPPISTAFQVINHTTSTNNLLFAGESITPGGRHAVQWDGVEWVVL